jgi:ABC-type transport system involved in cytochrome c biogenesis permease subunit
MLVAFSAPLVYAVVALVVTMVDGDMSNGYYIPVFVVLAAFAWFGWSMWNEEPLRDSRTRTVAA